MKAFVYDRYGPPEVLRLQDVAIPLPAADQVLVKIEATSVNLSDWECLDGSPLYARINGLRSPATPTLGSDIAGVVEAVGSEVSGFTIGDEVYGDNLWLKGGFAEFAVAPAKALTHKPQELSFVEAAAIPQSGAIAMQSTEGATTGTRVLINGAGGGTGAFAVPLAKRAGAHVTAVDNAEKLEFMTTLGADRVLDYRKDDFTRTEPYDLIVDLVANRSVLAYHRVLAKGGRFRCVGGSVSTLLQVVTVGSVLGLITGRRLGVLGVQGTPAHFGPVAELCAAGELAVHVDRCFALEEVPQALAYVGNGHSLGKVVVVTGDDGV